MKPLRIGMIGLGYWGQIILKKLLKNPNYSVDFAVDRKSAHREMVAADLNFSAQTELDLTQLTKVDLFAITTQVGSHEELLRQAVAAGVSVFCTKPILRDPAVLIALQKEFTRTQKLFFADHVHLYGAAYRILRDHYTQPAATDRYISRRTQLGKVQPGSNVFWELFYHDVYLVLDLFGVFVSKDTVSRVTARAQNVLGAAEVDECEVTVEFKSGRQAICHTSMATAQREKRVELHTRTGVWGWDDTLSGAPSLVGGSGPQKIPKIDTLDTLWTDIAETLREVSLYPRHRHSDLTASIQVAKLLMACEISARKGGAWETLT